MLNKTIVRWQNDFLHNDIKSLVVVHDNKDNITITLDGGVVFKGSEKELVKILDNIINLPIDETIKSQNSQIRVFALMDKRCGKKKIAAHKAVDKYESDVLCVRKYVTVRSN
ncbi:MAG: hypothetical protein NZZ41_08045 [Candidatus Dojkabacteria bacterium]|nr:hypothetical protein [Candidatus Dojkabacteria bacterium]